MGNIELNRIEIEILKQLIRLRYGISFIEANNNANYRGLYEQINRVRENNQIPAEFNLRVSEDQLRRLFCGQEERMAFRRYFIQLCYFYACGQFREAHLESHPIENQAVALKSVPNQVLPIEIEEEEVQGSVLLLKENDDLKQENNDLKQQLIEKSRLRQEKMGLENDLEQTVHQINVLNHQLMESKGVTQLAQKQREFLQKAAIALIISLLGFAVYFWYWKERRYEELVWLNGHNLNNEQEGIYLKSKLTFITDSTSEFRKQVHIWVKLLMQGCQKLDNPPITKPSPDLINFKELKSYEKDRNYKLYAIDNNKYYIDLVTWRDPNQDSIWNESRLLDSVNTLFGGYVNDLMEQKTKWLHLNMPDDSFFESFFDVNPSERYKPIFMFAVLKTDTTFGNHSREIMVRYPPYDTKNVDAAGKTYHLQSRPWWRDAIDGNRSKSFSWIETIEGQEVTMGLSRAYSSIRVDHRMQQRAFWIEIPVKKPSKFFLCIDFKMKID